MDTSAIHLAIPVFFLLVWSLASFLLPLPGPVAAGGVALATTSAAWILRGRKRGLPLAAGLR